MVDIHFKHPDGWSERVRKLAPGTTKREAELYEQRVLASLMAGTYGTEQNREVPTFEQFAQDWYDEHVLINCKSSVQRTTKSALNAHLLPFFGPMHLDKINQRDIARFKSKLAKQSLADKTINNHLGVLSSCLNTAAEWEVIDHAPDIKWLKAAKPEIDFLDFDEALRLMEAVPERSAVMVLAALKTGLRLGELCALRWQDVDLIKGQLRVCRAATRGIIETPKSGKSRTVPIPDVLVSALKAHKAQTFMRSDLVFCGPEGQLLTRDHVKRVLPQACKKAGLREIQWHGLRHTYASHLVMLGVPLKVVQELLGHASLEMTMRYAHLSPDSKHEAVQLLNTAQIRHKEKASNPS